MQFYFEDKNFKRKFSSKSRVGRTIYCVRLKKKAIDNSSCVKDAKKRREGGIQSHGYPRIMFAATVVMVLIDGFYRTQGVNRFTPIEIHLQLQYFMLGH